MRWLSMTPLLLSLACAETPATQQPPPDTPVVPPAKPDPVDVSVDPGTPADLLPPKILPEDPFRERRRMDLDQLDTTIRTVTGGIGWTEMQGVQEVNLFEQLASTLGKPDYLTITTEDLTPSAMFQKFLDDAARAVCTDLMQVEQNRAEADRVFFVDARITDTYADAPDAVGKNLRQLVLRFHGRNLAADAPELDRWVWLMKSAEHVSGDQAEVWKTVCVGLITHPDFYTY